MSKVIESAKKLDAFGTGGGSARFGSEAIPNPVADALNLFPDLATDFLTACRGKQDRGTDSDAYSGGEGENVAESMIFTGVEILGPIAKIGHSVAGAINALGDAVPHVVGNVFRLFQQIDCGFEN
jgi:hypothetical protein